MRSNRSIPPSTVIPELAYPDVTQAAAWLCDAFGFRRRLVIGGHRVQLVLGDGAIVVVQAPRGVDVRADRSHAIMVRVEDADAHHARALAAGARIVGPPRDQPYGERQYAAEDLAGHVWTFTQSIADVAPEDWGGELSSDAGVVP